MSKPYIICHMMMTVDGRIDCTVMEKLQGVQEYYAALDSLQANAALSGRVTAQLEMAQQGEFAASDKTPLGAEGFSKKAAVGSYDVVVDTKGSLLWEKRSEQEKPLIVITSEQVSHEYLQYLDDKDISWIACGREKIDLARAAAVLHDEFGVERMAVVGGGTINAGFLTAGLLDEVSILLAPGIDGRKGMTAAFDGLLLDSRTVTLNLLSVASYTNGSVWLRYSINK